MSTSPAPGLLFHTGLMVADLASAMQTLGVELGVRWTPVMEATQRVRTEQGEIDVTLSLVYSMGGPHRVELVQQVPGTVWSTAPGQDVTVHHLGYWTDDLAADSAALARHGAPVVAVPVLADGSAPRWVYHRSALGTIIELVASETRASMDRLWSA